eukprot:GCRY01003968.1.p1 GENE.GCRY01003968.1~~GCRY01003968.1.p1  ORF type:complete len:1096 (+),score=133.55 GCRY01003968.1:108-3395(+)
MLKVVVLIHFFCLFGTVFSADLCFDSFGNDYRRTSNCFDEWNWSTGSLDCSSAIIDPKLSDAFHVKNQIESILQFAKTASFKSRKRAVLNDLKGCPMLNGVDSLLSRDLDETLHSVFCATESVLSQAYVYEMQVSVCSKFSNDIDNFVEYNHFNDTFSPIYWYCANTDLCSSHHVSDELMPPCSSVGDCSSPANTGCYGSSQCFRESDIPVCLRECDESCVFCHSTSCTCPSPSSVPCGIQVVNPCDNSTCGYYGTKCSANYVCDTDAQACVHDDCSFSSLHLSSDDLKSCLASIPPNTVANNATLSTVYETLTTYSFKDMMVDASGVFPVQVDLLGTLQSLSSTVFPYDCAFHEAIQEILQSVNDAHLMYLLPEGYAFASVIPLEIHPQMVNGVQTVYLSVSSSHESYYELYGSSLLDLEGQILEKIDDTDVLDYFAAQKGLFRDDGVRFNYFSANFFMLNHRAFSGLAFRLLNNVTLSTKNPSTGVSTDRTLQWMFLNVNEISSRSAIESLNSMPRFETRDLSKVEEKKMLEQILHQLKGRSHILSQSLLPFQKEQKRVRDAITKHPQKPLNSGHSEKTEVRRNTEISEEERKEEALEKIKHQAKHPVGRRSDFSPALKLQQQLRQYRMAREQESAAQWGYTGSYVAGMVIGKVCFVKLTTFGPDDDDVDVFVEEVRKSVSVCYGETAEYLVIDVIRNNGGFVRLGYIVAQYLVESCSGFDGLYDLIHGGSSPSSDWLDNIITQSTLYDFEGFRDQDYANVSTRAAFTSHDWYDGPAYTRGGRSSQYTMKMTIFPETQVNDLYAPVPSAFFPASRIVLLTDGFCGSTCALFLTKLKNVGGLQVAALGGMPSLSSYMEGSSFAGGFVLSSEILDAFSSLSDYGFSAPAPLPTSATLSWNLGEVYSYNNTDVPAQFDYSDADVRIPYWQMYEENGLIALYTAIATQNRRALDIEIPFDKLFPNKDFCSGNEALPCKTSTNAVGLFACDPTTHTFSSQCLQKTCSAPSETSYEVSCSTSEFTVGSSCTVSCREGFKLKDSSANTITCQADGGWTIGSSCVEDKDENSSESSSERENAAGLLTPLLLLLPVVGLLLF